MNDPGTVLIVCTGNVCRSPYIERMLQAQLADLGIEVSSAGTGALVDFPIDPGSVRLLEAAGVNANGFAARDLTAGMVQDADLVLTATREHRTQVVQLAPKGLRHTFVIDDFADLVAGSDLSQPAFMESPDGPAIRRLIARAMRYRDAVAPRSNELSGIVDPFRQGPDVFDQMAHQVSAVLPVIERAIRQVVECDQNSATGQKSS